jgi:tetratricopeptide (TPR) repeat protein
MRSRLLPLVLAASLLGLPALAKSSRAQAASLVRQAQKLYQRGKYHDAAETLEKADALAPDPRLVFNIARAYDQAGELEKALDAYQRYVGSPQGTDATLLKRSSLAIDRLRGLIDQKEKAKAADEAAQRQLQEQADAAKRRAQEQTEAAEQARAQAQAQQRAQAEAQAHAQSRNQTLAYVASGLAVVGLGTGVVAGLSARSAKSDFNDAQTVEEKQSFQTSTQHRALLADVGFGVAIAGAVTAYLLWPRHSSVTVAPAVGSAGGGASMQVRF